MHLNISGALYLWNMVFWIGSFAKVWMLFVHNIMPTCNTLKQFTKIKCVHTHKIEKIATGKWDEYIFPNQLHCILLHLFKHCVHFIDILKFYWLFYLSLQCISLFLDIHVIKLHFLALFMFLPLFRMNGTFNEINSIKKFNIKTTTLCDSL